VQISDLVRKYIGCDMRHEPWKSHGLESTGIVVRIDKDFYGAGSAFKTHPTDRGNAIRDRRSPDFIAKTARGIRDRVFVFWQGEHWTYEDSYDLKVIEDGG